MSEVVFTRNQRFMLAVDPPVMVALLHVLCRTLRFIEHNDEGARPADRFPYEPGVYVFWHRALLLAAYRYRNLGIRILISASFDGELIARVVERLGFVPVRGCSSRGGAAGLLALLRARQTEHKVAITADGPRGPLYVAKPGAAAVAQRSGSTVSVFYLHAENAWILDSWDRFIIPKPFSRIHIFWQTPLRFSAPLGDEEATAMLQHALDHTVQQAERRS